MGFLTPINIPILGVEEETAVIEAIRRCELTNSSYYGGTNVKQSEKELMEYLGARDAVMVNSGTAAIQATLMALEVGKGDEVLLPSFTFVATANAVLSLGARPVFVDISAEDYCMDISDLEKKISSKTKAIIPVHLYGYPADMRSILSISEPKGIPVVEDSCQSLGSKYDGKYSGTVGDAGCFSFYPAKVITAGEGGAVVTDREDLADKIRMIRNHGMARDSAVRSLGLNYRMSELSAVMICAQMKKLGGFLAARKKNAEILSRHLSYLEHIKLPKEANNREHNWYLYTIRVLKSRERVIEELHRKGIGATVYYPTPIHLQPYYLRTIGKIELPETERAAREVLSLPIHPAVNIETLEQTGDLIKSVLR